MKLSLHWLLPASLNKYNFSTHVMIFYYWSHTIHYKKGINPIQQYITGNDYAMYDYQLKGNLDK